MKTVVKKIKRSKEFKPRSRTTSKWTKDNRKFPLKTRCGAKRRGEGKGLKCKNWAMPNGRCRIHGGAVKGMAKGEKRALTHGLYEAGLHEEEKVIYDTIMLGSVDEELKMLKIKLRRCHRAQRMWEEQRIEVNEELEDTLTGDKTRNHFDVESVEEHAGHYLDKKGKKHRISKRKIIRSKKDFSADILRYTRLVADLEIKRKELIQGLGDKDFIEKMVKEFRGFSDGAVGTLPGGEM